MEFKPGTAVNMIFEADFLVNTTRVMKAVIYDVKGKNILISQTSPPLLSSHRNRAVQISFLTKRSEMPARFAASAVISSFIPNYELSSEQTVPAILLEQLTELQEVNIRMFFRVKPSAKSNMVILLGPEKLTLMDISLGGAKFSHPQADLVQYGQEVKLIFVFDGRRFEVKARAARIWTKTETDATKRLQFFSINFEPGQREFEYFLGKKIMMMERETIAEGRIE